jgi:hypothetical protein
MIWNLVVYGQIALWVEVGEDFLGWFRHEARDPFVANIDYYRDMHFEVDTLQRLLAQLIRIEFELRAQIIERIANRKQLPIDSEVRKHVLHHLIKLGLQDHPQVGKFAELKAAI